MSIGYRAVQWNAHKLRYDAMAGVGVLSFIGVFLGVSLLLHTGDRAIGAPVLLMRALGSCAIVLLHIVLCIGPAARLDKRFLPLLANRRHLGVLTFLVALLHALLAVGYYHAFGDDNPLVSLLRNSLSTSADLISVRRFPFELLGAAALAILFLLAATSHDFWLKTLSAKAWKRLHMLVYVAYALLVGHVALGTLQSDRGWAGALALCIGAVIVTTLHLTTGVRESRRDRAATATPSLGTHDTPDIPSMWLDAGPAADIAESRARIVSTTGGERIAVFKHDGAISAVTNVCAHQGGPLGEGKIINGCITCPWHAWQYRPGDGCSPPPFTERIATYEVRVVDGRVRVNPLALPPGTPVEPARAEGAADA